MDLKRRQSRGRNHHQLRLRSLPIPALPANCVELFLMRL
jgi:hypothetical protein